MDGWGEFLFGFGRFSPWVLAIGGWVWLDVIAWRRSALWGIAGIVFVPSLFLLAWRDFHGCRLPLAFMLMGAMLLRPTGLLDIEGRNPRGLAAVIEKQADIMRQQQRIRETAN